MKEYEPSGCATIADGLVDFLGLAGLHGHHVRINGVFDNEAHDFDLCNL
jgi:hypothetical protein